MVTTVPLLQKSTQNQHLISGKKKFSLKYTTHYNLYRRMTTTSSANITNELILEEIKKSKQELKASIEAVEVKVLLKIEEVNRRINALEQKNKNLEDKLENIERTQRKK
ncbi:hypothetical protein NQ318_001153 [Aromia moschata]|uniref:Uncharacterized protein n=1 Tax=Aromia moschata TaxID=1265417 RepID=A0AAV8ZFQ1_9CUCU|nr:hypothetical protein NQ318_001153 [Aromia moschata]